MSWEAKGIATYIGTNETIQEYNLFKLSTNDEGAIKSAVKELVNLGYALETYDEEGQVLIEFKHD